MKVCVCLLLLVCLGCVRTAPLVVEIGPDKEAYSVQFEKGLFLRNNGRAHILLLFSRPKKFFTMDTGERLHVYIVGDTAQDAQSGITTIGHGQVFFVRVQRSPQFGFMDHDNVVIKSLDGAVVSGLFESRDIYPIRDIHRRIRLAVSDLPLEIVSSREQLHQADDAFFLDIVRQHMGKEWFLAETVD